MTTESLEKANKLKKEIDILTKFCNENLNASTGTLIKRKIKSIFGFKVSYSYETYEMNFEIKNKVLGILVKHTLELEKQLKELE